MRGKEGEKGVNSPVESRLKVLCKIPSGLLCSWVLNCWEAEGTRQHKPPSPVRPLSHVPATLHPLVIPLALSFLKETHHNFSRVRAGWPHTCSVTNTVLWNPEGKHTEVAESAWEVLVIPTVSKQNASLSHLQMKKYVLVLMLFSDNVIQSGSWSLLSIEIGNRPDKKFMQSFIGTWAAAQGSESK